MLWARLMRGNSSKAKQVIRFCIKSVDSLAAGPRLLQADQHRTRLELGQGFEPERLHLQDHVGLLQDRQGLGRKLGHSEIFVPVVGRFAGTDLKLQCSPKSLIFLGNVRNKRNTALTRRKLFGHTDDQRHGSS
jgi:hypothetical protein